jgi:hypothetical protein
VYNELIPKKENSNTKTRNGESRFRNVGLPNGGDSYGNGAFIVASSKLKNIRSQGKQRFFSSKSNAVDKQDGIRTLEELRKGIKDPTKTSLYKIVFDEKLLKIVYEKTKYYHRELQQNNKKEKNTFKTYKETFKKISQKTIQELSQELKTEKYKCEPIHKIIINELHNETFQNNNEKKIIGIPSIKDKLIQKVFKLILETIYIKE